MLSGNGLDNINVSSAILMSNNMNYMPLVLSNGIFGEMKYLPFEWAVSNVAVVDYTMKTDTDMLGSDAITDATVVPNIRATFSMKSVIVGRVEANILFHKRPNTSIESNLGTMHADMVMDGFTEWARAITKKIDYSLINGYKDAKYRQLGLRGMLDFATEINATPLDPKDYAACYSFFANQIDILVTNLGVEPSRIRVLIGNDVVQAMQMTPIAGTTDSVWQLLKSNVLQDVLVEVAPRGMHDNQCSFVSLGFIAPVGIQGTNLINLGDEKETVGPHQYVIYMDAVLPSTMVTNGNACRHQSEMIDTTKMLASSANQKGIKKNVDVKTAVTKPNAELSAVTKPNAEL